MKFFKKLNLYISLFLIIFNVNAKSEVINKVSIEGNERISLETVMIFADITIGIPTVNRINLLLWRVPILSIIF